MSEQEERRAINEVRDRPTEIWIKVVTFLVGVMMTMISTIGYLFIDRQDTFIDRQDAIIDGQKETNTALEKIKDNFNEKFNIYGAKFENHDGRITRAEADVREVRNTQTDYGKRIIKLERRK